MNPSDTIRALLALNGRKQSDLAEFFGMTVQSMNNKFSRGSWSAKDLTAVAEFTGCKLAFVLPDGNKLVLGEKT